MSHALRRITNIVFALLIAVFSVNLSGVMTLQNAHAASNNGTLKVQEKGSILPDSSNDPKVCTFKFVADNLDANQTGNITIEGQGSTPAGVYLVVPISTNNGGDGSSAYINETPTLTLAAGHYKATMDNKFGTDPGDKAKSKVFKVDCTTAQATAPTFTDPCGTSNDKLVIPNDANAKYQILSWIFWNDIQPGTYNNQTGTVTIRAIGKTSGINLVGQTQWGYTYTNATCTTTVVPTAPTVKNDVCGTTNDKYTIPAKTGVVYKINGNTVSAGDYATNGASSVTITAVPLNATYVLSGQTSWTLTFDTTPCPVQVTATPATNTDETCGTANDKYVIPDVPGVQYYVNNVATAPGTYATGGALSLTITVSAKQGYVLTNPAASWTLIFTDKTCVTPAEPTKIDTCGKANDKYVIPTTTGVIYKVGGVTKNAGQYQTNSDVTVTAVAANGNYVLTGTTSWLLDFSQQNCPATVTKPVLHDACGTHNDYYTIPSIEGVDYKVSKFGVIYTGIAAGDHWADGLFYVKAEPKLGYELTGTTFWALYLNPENCKVTANDPTFIDECGSVNDKFIIPTTQHVTYKIATKWIWFIVWIPVEFDTINAGTYDGNGLVKIVAEPEDGYSINGDWFWIHNFDSGKCHIGAVTNPTFTDPCGDADDSYTIVPAQGVTYKVNGNVAPAGFMPNATGAVTVTAEATDPNYVLNGTTSWSHTFSDATCPDITATALCDQAGVIVSLVNDGDTDGTAFVNGNPVVVPANGNAQATVPYTLYKAAVVVTDDKQQTLLDKDFDCTPGRGGIGGEPTSPSVVLTKSVSNAPKGIMLPETGASPLVQAFMLALAGLSTYGIMFFLVNRRELNGKK